MLNARKFGGGYCIYRPLSCTERGNGSLISVPSKRLPKGGQRWFNTSEMGGVIYG